MPRHTIVENSPVALEPTAEELQQSMVEPSARHVTAEEIIPVAKTEPAKLPSLADTDVEQKILVGDKLYTQAQLQEFIAQSKKHSVNDLPDATEPSATGMMLVANCFVKTSKVGSTVPLSRVTPAEVMFLSAEHHSEAGGNPIKDLEILGEVKRDGRSEVQRLGQKYSPAKLKAMFPGAIPQLPSSFRQAVEIGTNTQLPESRLMEHDIASKE